MVYLHYDLGHQPSGHVPSCRDEVCSQLSIQTSQSKPVPVLNSICCQPWPGPPKMVGLQMASLQMASLVSENHDAGGACSDASFTWRLTLQVHNHIYTYCIYIYMCIYIYIYIYMGQQGSSPAPPWYGPPSPPPPQQGPSFLVLGPLERGFVLQSCQQPPPARQPSLP